MNTVLLSVIVPVYNVEKYLDKCVHSIVDQTYSNLEIILVDDGSTDNCPQMCDKWVSIDSRIKVVHKKNGGLGDARNAGLDVATGDYVAFVDSDDHIAPLMYETLMKKAIDNNLDVVKSGFTREYEDGNLKPLIDMDARQEIGREALLKLLPMHVQRCGRALTYTVTSCTSVYRRCIVPRFVSERQYISEDLIFTVEYLLRANSFAYIPQSYYYYYIRCGSITNTYDEKTFTLIKSTATYLDNIFKGIDSDIVPQYVYNKVHLLIKMIILPADMSSRQKYRIIKGIITDSQYLSFLQRCDITKCGTGLKGIKNKIGLSLQRNGHFRLYYIFSKLDKFLSKLIKRD